MDGPDFLGIGAQKAGTSWLHANLAQHPRVRFPAGKEVHFWNRERERGVSWYRSRFIGAGADQIQGDITPAYALLAPDVIAEIRSAFPQLKLFFLVRDPVERAWSGARMALERAEMEAEEASDAWFLDHFRSRGSRARGDYATTLTRWLAHFPRPALQILRYEEIGSNPEGVARAVCGHLGIPAEPLLSDQNVWLRARVREGANVALRPNLRAALFEIYAEPMRRLEEEFGISWERS